MLWAWLYILLWIWFCKLSNAEIFHALGAGALIALPILLWPLYARRSTRTKADLRDPFEQEYERRREEDARRNTQISDERVDLLATQILRRNRDLLEKFFEITGERLLCSMPMAMRNGMPCRVKSSCKISGRVTSVRTS